MIFRLNVRADQVAAVILLFVLLAKVLLGIRRLYIDFPAKMLLLFLAISLVSSIFNAPDPRYSILQTINIASVSSIYVVLTNFLDSEGKIKQFLRYYLRAGFFFMLVGVSLFVLSLALRTRLYGVNLDGDNPYLAYGVYATMREPNIFGSYCLIYFVVSLGLLVVGKRCEIGTRRFLKLLFFISSLGLILSFTRGAWLGGVLGAALLIHFVFEYFRGATRKRRTIAILLSVMVIVLIVSSVASDFFLSYKIRNLLQYKSGTGLGRLIVWGEALRGTEHHILLGNGTYSFASLFNLNGSYNDLQNAWIGNVFITALHDAGVLGFIAFMAMLIGLIIMGTRKFKKSKEQIGSIPVLSLIFVMAMVGMLLAFFFTTGFSYGYAWIPLGVLGALGNPGVAKYSI